MMGWFLLACFALYSGEAFADSPGKIIAAGISGAFIGLLFVAAYGIRRLVIKLWRKK